MSPEKGKKTDERAVPARQSWELEACLVWWKGGWGAASLLSTHSWDGGMEALGSSDKTGGNG